MGPSCSGEASAVRLEPLCRRGLTPGLCGNRSSRPAWPPRRRRLPSCVFSCLVSGKPLDPHAWPGWRPSWLCWPWRLLPQPRAAPGRTVESAARRGSLRSRGYPSAVGRGTALLLVGGGGFSSLKQARGHWPLWGGHCVPGLRGGPGAVPTVRR